MIRTGPFYVAAADLPAVQAIADQAGAELVYSKGGGPPPDTRTAQFVADFASVVALKLLLNRKADAPPDRVLDSLTRQRAWSPR